MCNTDELRYLKDLSKEEQDLIIKYRMDNYKSRREETKVFLGDNIHKDYDKKNKSNKHNK